jgi:hypothetical protein
VNESPVVGSLVHYVGEDVDRSIRCHPAVVTEVGQYVTVVTLTTVPTSFDRSEGRPIREIRLEQWWYSDACALFVPTLNPHAYAEECPHAELDVEVGTWHYPHPPKMQEPR